MMDKFRQKINSDKPSLSLLQADKQFVKKILARNSSVGSNSAYLADNFRVSAEVPFKWESRPGEPKHKSRSLDNFPPASLFKDRPKRVDYFATAPTIAAAADPIPATADGDSRRSTRDRVRYFWKKVVEKGQKRFGARKNGGDRPPAAAAAVAVARRYHSAELGLHRLDDHNVGFSRGSVSGSSSPNGYNLRLEKSSKIQNFTYGFIKWVF